MVLQVNLGGKLKPEQHVSVVVSEDDAQCRNKQEHKEVDDVLSEATAMMHGVTSGSPTSTVKLGPVVTAEILLEEVCLLWWTQDDQLLL